MQPQMLGHIVHCLHSCNMYLTRTNPYAYAFVSKVSGEPMDDRFSEVGEIFGYVPQVRIDGFQYPFLLCNIADLHDKDIIGWDKQSDPSYDSQNLVNDVQPGNIPIDESLFSIVKDWNVKKAKSLLDSE